MTRKNILIVDDDPGMIRVLRGILAEVATLRFATSGAQAIRLVHEAPPDLVLLDAQMPAMSGFKVCQTLKSDPRFAPIPVIFVTGHTDTAFEDAGITVGAADFIRKPVDAALVLARVRAQLHVASRWHEIEGIDTVDVCERLGGNWPVFTGMLRRLLGEFADIATLPDPADEGSWSTLAERLHRLRGAAGMLGARSIQHTATQAEAACHCSDEARTRPLMADLSAQFARLGHYASPWLDVPLAPPNSR